MKLFLDTNIILDLLEPKRPDATASISLFELVRRKKIELFVSTQSIIDSYYIGGRFGLPKKEIDVVALWILDHINVRSIDCMDLKNAVLSANPDVEDNAQLAMAESCGCNFFVTNDKNALSRKEGFSLTCISPVKLIERMN